MEAAAHGDNDSRAATSEFIMLCNWRSSSEAQSPTGGAPAAARIAPGVPARLAAQQLLPASSCARPACSPALLLAPPSLAHAGSSGLWLASCSASGIRTPHCDWLKPQHALSLTEYRCSSGRILSY